MKIEEAWPALPLAAWKDTCDTLQMWTQIAGKIRMALAPKENHWWNVPLYVTSRGLTTTPIPYGSRIFEIAFDFIDHNLVIETNDGAVKRLPLEPRAVADFYQDVMALLQSLDIHVEIHRTPVEVPNPIPFDRDRVHQSYDREYAHRFWRILVSADEVFKEFRARFLGKSSPVHFFWGSFDLAVTRFSGRRAPERPGADAVTREAYSHEAISAGFWPGHNSPLNEAAFYSYAAPEPAGFAQETVRPSAARYDARLSEFILPYEELRRAESPKTALLEFMQSAYEAGAKLGNWDREALERETAR